MPNYIVFLYYFHREPINISLELWHNLAGRVFSEDKWSCECDVILCSNPYVGQMCDHMCFASAPVCTNAIVSWVKHSYNKCVFFKFKMMRQMTFQMTLSSMFFILVWMECMPPAFYKLAQEQKISWLDLLTKDHSLFRKPGQYFRYVTVTSHRMSFVFTKPHSRFAFVLLWFIICKI